MEREEVPFDNSFNQTVPPLTISLNKFCFSANMDEDSELAEKVLNRDFPELSKRSPKMAPNNNNKHAESSKINKKPIFLKSAKFIQNENHLQDLFKEIYPNVTILKSTFYPSGNIKILPKTTNDYLLITNWYN